jgi:hypothetical protein
MSRQEVSSLQVFHFFLIHCILLDVAGITSKEGYKEGKKHTAKQVASQDETLQQLKEFEERTART